VAGSRPEGQRLSLLSWPPGREGQGATAAAVPRDLSRTGSKRAGKLSRRVAQQTGSRLIGTGPAAGSLKELTPQLFCPVFGSAVPTCWGAPEAGDLSPKPARGGLRHQCLHVAVQLVPRGA
jgi:hypothetical protein